MAILTNSHLWVCFHLWYLCEQRPSSGRITQLLQPEDYDDDDHDDDDDDHDDDDDDGDDDGHDNWQTIQIF